MTAAPSLRRTKLVCTIGPASARQLEALVAVGLDVARLNFSHGTLAEKTRWSAALRAAAAAAGRPIAILADLSGPKIRLGDLPGGELQLEAGAGFELRPRAGGRADAAGSHVTYPALARDVRPGDRVLLADGAAELRVTTVDGTVATEVVRGGLIRSRAGVAIPAHRLSAPSLTARDRLDVPRAIGLGVDYIAQSFVRSADDVRALRDTLGPDGPPIVAKIETQPAVEAFDEILDIADAVMIARGDLGVELPYEEVPLVQKQLVRRALDRGVPSIVATQMLESMVTSPRPTRAEASDVANAVFDGADAIMLSGETAIGAYPLLAAGAAVRIATLCEERGERLLPAGSPAPVATDAGSLAWAAVKLAEADPSIAGIACYTRTGRTARMLAALRPRVPVIAFSPDQAVIQRLCLVNGVVPRPCVPPGDVAGKLGLMAWLLGETPLLPAGSAAVLVASTAEPGSGPNLLEVRRVPG